MDWQTIKTHLLDFTKGLLAAMAVAAGTAALQYFGAHIPALLQTLTAAGSGVVAIKLTR